MKTFRFWGIWGVFRLAANVLFGVLAVWVFYPTSRDIPVLSTIVFVIAILIALVQFGRAYDALRWRNRRFEIDDQSIRFYTRHDEPLIERPWSDIKALRYKSFFGWRTEFTVDLRGSSQLEFDWSLENRNEFVQLLEEKSGLLFQGRVEYPERLRHDGS